MEDTESKPKLGCPLWLGVLVAVGYVLPPMLGSTVQVHGEHEINGSSLMGTRTPAPFGWVFVGPRGGGTSFVFDPLCLWPLLSHK